MFSFFDILMLGIICLSTYNGTVRGIILELFDIVVFILSFGITLNVYFSVGKAVCDSFPTSAPVPYYLAFAIVFSGCFYGLTMLALYLNKIANLHVTMKTPNQIFGGIFAFIKSLIVVGLVIFFLQLIPFSGSAKEALRTSYFRSNTELTTQAVITTIETLGPKEIEQSFNEFVENNNIFSKEKKEKTPKGRK